MPRSDIPEDVLRFIERRIDSVPHLEALLLLWETPGKEWGDAEVSARVYVGVEQARGVLSDLARSGLITAVAATPERHIYNPAWDDADLMTKVAAAYRRHLVTMSQLIHTKTASQAVQDFARAFQFKSGD